MKFVIQTGNLSDDWNLIETGIPVADKMGFWGAVLPDHYMWGEGRGGNSTMETWTTLTFMAARTEQIHLGTMVTPIPFRPPGMLAKQLSTLDIITGGRVLLGVGAGWSQIEFEGYSEWNEPKVRVDKTLEGLELILKLWSTSGKVDWKGKYYSANGAVLEPKPIQKPHPPLLFGGFSKRMLRMAGKYADICLILDPEWTHIGVEESRRIVLESAKKNSREDKFAFAARYFSREKYDRSEVEKSVAKAKDDKSEYFLVSFPKEDHTESIKDFAREIMPSYL